MDAKHIVITKMFEEEVNTLLKGREERQPKKKKRLCLVGQFFYFFSIKDFLNKKDVSQKEFLEDLGLLIVKNNLPIQFVKSMWLKRLISRLCPKLNFPSKR